MASARKGDVGIYEEDDEAIAAFQQLALERGIILNGERALVIEPLGELEEHQRAGRQHFRWRRPSGQLMRGGRLNQWRIAKAKPVCAPSWLSREHRRFSRFHLPGGSAAL